MTAVVIIPTTGATEVDQAIQSVLDQTYTTDVYLVVDGKQNYARAQNTVRKFDGHSRVYITALPINVGANGFYGHRVYAAFTHLVDHEFVLYLDQDNWLEPDHVQSCIDTIHEKNLQWTYSLRNIYSDNNYVCRDDCESLGRYPSYHGINHIDTSAYCVKREQVLQFASVWHGGWGQDRVWYDVLKNMLPDYDCTGKYTLNYRVAGNAGSVTADFFLNGNRIQQQRYQGQYPWQKT